MDNQQFISVEGPIGVGKTTLARRLADTYGGRLLLEGVDDNPFLERFYAEPTASALPLQLFFLFQRIRQLEERQQDDLFETVRVADYVFDKDHLFASLTLDPNEMEIYEQVYEHLAIEIPTPDLVIYLQAPIEVLRERIARRGRRIERKISDRYLALVVDGYMRLFHSYDRSPLLIVNASQVDFTENETAFQALLEEIEAKPHGRWFYNPLPQMTL